MENDKKKSKKRKHKITNHSSDGEEDEKITQSENYEEPRQDIGKEINFTKTDKRTHDPDSDHESEPKKKKKKKKPIVSADTPGNKNEKSKRQMKRERFAERQLEMASAAKQQLKTECLNYLSQWKHNRQNWKFMKAKQVWLTKNKFVVNLVPDDSWPLLLEYFESAKGNIRKTLLTDANKIIKQMDDWTETNSDKDNDDEDKSEKPSEAVYKRARELIQFLQE